MIGSLQITVPAGCMNDCGFCVYRQHATKFKTLWNSNHEKWSRDVERRLRYAADRVAAVMITSHGEPTINMTYIQDIMEILNRVTPDLAHVEIQSSGVGLTEEKLDALDKAGIRVISLSLPALDLENITEIMKIPEKYDYDPIVLSELIRSKGFTLRYSIAMTDWFDGYSLEHIMKQLETVWKPHQVSFKKLYGADIVATGKYEEMVEEFKSNPEYTKLELLSLGLWKYDARGMGVVWNDDCMVSEEQEDPRYLILQPDGKLY
ncbi:MAG: radical SAM protein, partial [Candidatus Thorarchaeota archaeon]|nr:radical SAM protein [Candidatus Thorarchaeota archaeon]